MTHDAPRRRITSCAMTPDDERKLLKDIADASKTIRKSTAQRDYLIYLARINGIRRDKVALYAKLSGAQITRIVNARKTKTGEQQ